MNNRSIEISGVELQKNGNYSITITDSVENDFLTFSVNLSPSDFAKLRRATKTKNNNELIGLPVVYFPEDHIIAIDIAISGNFDKYSSTALLKIEKVKSIGYMYEIYMRDIKRGASTMFLCKSDDLKEAMELFGSLVNRHTFRVNNELIHLKLFLPVF